MTWIVPFILALSVALPVIGCGTKYSAARLDDHIVAVQLGIFKAACAGVVIDPNAKDSKLALGLPLAATFTIQTTFALDLGASTGTLPFDLSGSGQHQGTVAVTVPFIAPADTDKPCEKADALEKAWEKRKKKTTEPTPPK